MTLKFKIASLLFFLLISINSFASLTTAPISSSSTSNSQEKRLDKVENDVPTWRELNKTYEDYYKTAYNNLYELVYLIFIFVGIALASIVAIQLVGVNLIVKQKVNKAKVELDKKIQDITSVLSDKIKTETGILDTRVNLVQEITKKIDAKYKDLDDEIDKAKKDFEQISKSNFEKSKIMTSLVEHELLGYVRFGEKNYRAALTLFTGAIGRWQSFDEGMKNSVRIFGVMNMAAKCIYKIMESKTTENLVQIFIDELLKEVKKKEYAGTAKYADEAYKEWKDKFSKPQWEELIAELLKPIEQKEQTPPPQA